MSPSTPRESSEAESAVEVSRDGLCEWGTHMNLNDEVKALEELERAIASGNQETIAKVAVANILPLYHEHYELLTSTVDRLPSKLIERFPILRFGHRMTPVLARTSRPFKPLIDPDAARTMSADELDVFTLVQMISFRFSGDVSAALVYARRLEDRILDVRVESRERVDGPLWFYHYEIGSTLLAAGDSSRSLLEFSTARQLGRLSRQRDAERLALCRAALAHALRGSLDEAESALAEAALHPPPTASHVAASRTTEASAAALIAVERMTDDVDERLAELDAYDSVQLTWPFALLARARLLLASNGPAKHSRRSDWPRMPTRCSMAPSHPMSSRRRSSTHCARSVTRRPHGRSQGRVRASAT